METMASSFLYIERTTFQREVRSLKLIWPKNYLSEKSEHLISLGQQKNLSDWSNNVEFHFDEKPFKLLWQKDAFQKADHRKYGLNSLGKRLIYKILFYLSLNYPNLI